ncbi:MAG: hypothetical protein ABEI86_08230 [Halobacteriaceae archaeon]
MSPDVTPVEPEEKYHPLIESIHARAGDHVRIILRYTPDTVDIYYLDGTLLDDDLLPRLGELHEMAMNGTVTTGERNIEEFGRVESIVLVHERALVLQFIESEEDGLIATVDRDEDLSIGEIL